MFLDAVWTRFRGMLGPREAIDLNPVEQLALRYLLTFGPGSLEAVHQEVAGHRRTDREEVGEGLGHLTRAGLVEARFQLEDEAGGTLYVATKKGARLRSRIPLEPRGVTAFYL